MEPQEENKPEAQAKAGYGKGYGKRPVWQWILLYVVVAAVVYFVIYLLFFHHGSSSMY